MTKAQEKTGTAKVEKYNALYVELEEFEGFSRDRKEIEKSYAKAEREMKKYFLKAGEEVFNAVASNLCMDWEDFVEWAEE